MTPKMNRPEDRREFIRAGLRAAAFASLAFSGAFLAWKSSSRPGADAFCRATRLCGGCPKLAGCREPEAAEARRNDTFGGAKPRFLNRGKKRPSVLTLSIPRPRPCHRPWQCWQSRQDREVEWVDREERR